MSIGRLSQNFVDRLFNVATGVVSEDVSAPVSRVQENQTDEFVSVGTNDRETENAQRIRDLINNINNTNLSKGERRTAIQTLGTFVVRLMRTSGTTSEPLGNQAITALISVIENRNNDDSVDLRDYSNTDLVISAVTALGSIGKDSDAALNAVLPLLSDNNETVRLVSLNAIEDMVQNSSQATRDRVITRVLPFLSRGTDSEKEQVASMFGSIGHGSRAAVTALRRLLDTTPDSSTVVPPVTSSFDVRRSAIRSLGEIGSSQQVVTELLSIMENGEDSNQSQAKFALLSILDRLKDATGEDAQSALRIAMSLRGRSDLDFHMAADLAIENILNNSENPVALLMPFLNNRDQQMVDRVIGTLGSIGANATQDVREQIICMVGPCLDADNSNRTSAITTLGQVGQDSTAAVRALLSFLEDSEEAVIPIVRNALDEIIANSENPAGLLIPFLNDRNTSIVREVVRELGNVGANATQNTKTQIVSALVTLLNHRDANIVRGAVVALGNVGTNATQDTREQIVSALVTLLNDPEVPMPKDHIITALGKVGHNSSVAVEALLSKLYLPDSEERERALNEIIENSENPVAFLTPFLNNGHTHNRNNLPKGFITGALSTVRPSSSQEDNYRAIMALIPFLDVRTLRVDGQSRDIVMQNASNAIIRLGRIGLSQNQREQVTRTLTNLLTHAINSASFEVRDIATALRAVGQGISESTADYVVGELIPHCNSLRTIIKVAEVALTLGSIGAQASQTKINQAVRTLTPLLNEQNNSGVSRYATIALGEIGPLASQAEINQAVTAVTDFLQRSRGDITTMSRTLAQIGPLASQEERDQAARALLPHISNASEDFAIAAMNALGKIRNVNLPPADRRVAAGTLISYINGDNPRLTAAALPVLGNVGEGTEDEIKLMIEALSHNNADIRRGAIDALVNVGKDAVPHLIEKLGEMSGLAIMEILEKIGEDAIDDLTDELLQRNSIQGSSSAMTLAMIIGPGRARVSNEQLNTIITRIIDIAENVRTPRASLTRSRKTMAIQALALIGQRMRELYGIDSAPVQHISTALTNLSQSSNPEISRQASIALSRVAPSQNQD